MRVRWSADWKVGVEPIDQQHQRLVSLLNAIQDQLVGLPSIELRPLIMEVVSYTRYHFHTEETLMRARKWVGYDSHKAAHATCRAQLLAIVERMSGSHDLAAVREVECLLVHFITEHIQGTDRETWLEMKQQGLL